eukprot:835420-Pleurochrysis_carterae.AAC.6
MGRHEHRTHGERKRGRSARDQNENVDGEKTSSKSSHRRGQTCRDQDTADAESRRGEGWRKDWLQESAPRVVKVAYDVPVRIHKMKFRVVARKKRARVGNGKQWRRPAPDRRAGR